MTRQQTINQLLFDEGEDPSQFYDFSRRDLKRLRRINGICTSYEEYLEYLLPYNINDQLLVEHTLEYDEDEEGSIEIAELITPVFAETDDELIGAYAALRVNSYNHPVEPNEAIEIYLRARRSSDPDGTFS
jgi:hypothetical protein